MRFGRASITVTGTASPASLKTRVIPALRPTRPTVLVALIVMSSLFHWSPRLRLAWAAIQKTVCRPLASNVADAAQTRSAPPVSSDPEQSTLVKEGFHGEADRVRFPVMPLERYPVRARPRRKRGANYSHVKRLCKPFHGLVGLLGARPWPESEE